ncbi:hypothetical protein SAMN05216266_12090 [Amycolatopsis marina]|uniref:Uncharacterized protein n=1 Tax=Amycolatopsis marina TaxID=490629 RepID=A0A1I1C2V8_9PSEU|nr:hypothetical protein [Amycolatopsis marina]SFB57005.1 hypothetical protein SAMN05216266_12090 [Amycolatopsis marina]
MALAADLTGWWVGYAIGVPVVLVVAALLILIVLTVRRIAAVADDATGSLRRTRERTEVLWQVETTNRMAKEILDGAAEARRALGG